LFPFAEDTMFESIAQEGPVPFGARIKVIGVGGGGGNALNNMIQAGIEHVEYVAANTDAQALNRSLAMHRVELGRLLTRGLGAGGKPEVGAKAAQEDRDSLDLAIGDADMVFITAGMGGGTGTGAAPVVAQAAREAGALTVAIVTRPFGFEGRMRGRQADEGLRELADAVDTLIVIPNDRVLQMAPKLKMNEAFQVVDSVLVEAVRGISDIIQMPGLINVDFADVVSIMKGKGMALMGTGRASGDDRAAAAARMAISSPLLEDARIEGATGLLVSIVGSSDMTIQDVNEAMTLIQDAAAAETNTIFGTAIDESLGHEIKVTVVATGFDRLGMSRHAEPAHVHVGQSPARATVPVVQPRAVSSPMPVLANDVVRTFAAPAHAEAGLAMPTAGHRLPLHDLDTPAYVRRNTPSDGLPSLEPRRPEAIAGNRYATAQAAGDRLELLRK
jgi:cell division protein FtsZ